MFDPRKRIDATQALAHEYLAPYHDPSDEPIAPEPFDWSFNDADLPVDTWKIMMYSEVSSRFLGERRGELMRLFAAQILDFHNIENTSAATAEEGVALAGAVPAATA